MTDNEKCAHDIALLTTQFICNAKLNDADGKEVSLDVYDSYKTAYDAALKLVEKDFK